MRYAVMSERLLPSYDAFFVGGEPIKIHGEISIPGGNTILYLAEKHCENPIGASMYGLVEKGNWKSYSGKPLSYYVDKIDSFLWLNSFNFEFIELQNKDKAKSTLQKPED